LGRCIVPVAKLTADSDVPVIVPKETPMYVQCIGLILLSVWALASCATEKPAASGTSRIAPPPEIQAETSRKPPKPHFDSSIDWYPPQAKRQGLVGRVLVEFQIDRGGRVVSERVLGADAAPILQSAALAFVKAATFDVSDPRFDPADVTPFRFTVRFCLPKCGDIAPYPGTEDVTVSGYIVRAR
jgi:TonB family protein